MSHHLTPRSNFLLRLSLGRCLSKFMFKRGQPFGYVTSSYQKKKKTKKPAFHQIKTKKNIKTQMCVDPYTEARFLL